MNEKSYDFFHVFRDIWPITKIETFNYHVSHLPLESPSE